MEWLEKTVSPGVCLVARSRVVNQGVLGWLANRHMTPSGVWLLSNQGEAMLLDMPFGRLEEVEAFDRIAETLRMQKLTLKYLTVSHLHLDHAAGLSTALDRFPEATFVYPAPWPVRVRESLGEWLRNRTNVGLQGVWTRQPQITYEESFQGELGGEPLLFFDAPYHSRTDQLVVFRGLALLPDWHLPEGDESLEQVKAPQEMVAQTLQRLRQIPQQHNYVVHSRTAVHGDEPVREDFGRALETAYHRLAEPVGASPSEAGSNGTA